MIQREIAPLPNPYESPEEAIAELKALVALQPTVTAETASQWEGLVKISGSFCIDAECGCQNYFNRTTRGDVATSCR
jgi:hypothetical protein